MVATFPEPDDSEATLFKYLKRCSPQSPNVALGPAATTIADPFDRPPPLTKKRRRCFSLLFGAAQAAAISLGLWTTTLPLAQPVAEEPVVQTASGELWNALGSEAVSQAIRTAQAQQTQSALAAAKQSRLQAQQLRLDAEAKAQNLVDKAAEQARQQTVGAMRRADAIALDASYVGAEQVIYAEADTDVSLKFTARIQCREGSFA
ncbi:MAG: hypothetical protein DCF25_20920 [Leptolyngbya foveolarum]|uniref:Uncharacterized protein n=1 Tax=Leptolyngbya foveolarum TaxID=47253 RepID=A0A2W4VKW8_9CYAN|nr:MAG: hypothetical protein DCF25_20920 [Leptolyngbya foveolarum]